MEGNKSLYSQKISLLEVDDYYIKISTYDDKECNNEPIDSVLLECNTCKYYGGTIDSWISVNCDERKVYHDKRNILLILLMIFISILLLLMSQQIFELPTRMINCIFGNKKQYDL